MLKKTFWLLINADERGFMNGNDFVFNQRSSVFISGQFALDVFRSL
jgi:hypothetical protein